jgi:hypothetical protein
MADKEHVKRLKRGVAEWNAWRFDNQTMHPDLSGASLYRANLSGAYLGAAVSETGETSEGANLMAPTCAAPTIRVVP